MQLVQCRLFWNRRKTSSIGWERCRELTERIQRIGFFGCALLGNRLCMIEKKNHFVLEFDDNTLTIRINGKLVASYPKRDISREELEAFWNRIYLMIRHPYDGKESFEDMDVG